MNFLHPAVTRGVRHCPDAAHDALQESSLPRYNQRKKKKKTKKQGREKYISNITSLSLFQESWQATTRHHGTHPSRLHACLPPCHIKGGSQPETLSCKHKVKLESLRVPVLGRTFLSSFPSTLPRGQNQDSSASSKPSSPRSYLVSCASAPLPHPSTLESPLCSPQEPWLPFPTLPRAEDPAAWPRQKSDGWPWAADGKQEELVPTRCLVEQEGCNQL